MGGRRGDQDQTGGAVQERTSDQVKEPALFSVVLLNDDYTPMQFVVDVLETLFQKGTITQAQFEAQKQKLLGG